jgi:hypothetical protein
LRCATQLVVLGNRCRGTVPTRALHRQHGRDDRARRNQNPVAMPPYWFFYSKEGRQILEDRIGASHAIGMHVPTDVPDDPASRRETLQDVDLFTKQGETRAIP